MGLLSKHPLWSQISDQVAINRTFYRGSAAVKKETTTYLPVTAGMIIDGLGYTATGPKPGQAQYNSYLARAYVPDIYKESVEKKVGLVHKKPVVVNLPEEMKYLLTKANIKGGDIYSLYRDITFEQLVAGRVFLLADIVIRDKVPEFAFATYVFESVPNWDDDDLGDDLHKLKLVILDESGFERDNNFEWSKVSKVRVLTLDEAGKYVSGAFRGEGGGEPVYDAEAMNEVLFNGLPLTKIPGTFINTKDLFADPDEPPLTGLARAVATIYRLEADYRQALFMQTQDTFVIKGKILNNNSESDGDGDIRIGAGSFLNIEKDGDAGFEGVNSNGLSELRLALENDYKRAESMSSILVNTGTSQESGEALKTRVAAQTATLRQIAVTAAQGLESVLRDIATIMGLDPDEVTVVPNLDFTDSALATQTAVELLTAKNLGAPVSYETIHGVLRELNLTDKKFQEELDLIEEESDDPRIEMLRQIMGSGTGGSENSTPKGVDDPMKANDPQYNTNPGGVNG